jgi:hypothetical protein
MLFSPGLFWKNLQTDRPHLDPGLAWRPGRPPVRLAGIVDRVLPYRSETSIDQGVAMTRKVLAATVAAARARGAQALIVVPTFTPEEPGSRALRRRVLDEAGLPYVLVQMPPDWRIPGDGHPDARGDLAMAEAVAARLRPSLPVAEPTPCGLTK